jgi:hypothetical protein
MQPGTTWNFLNAQIPAGSVSGVVFSLTTKTLQEIGANLGVDDIVADYMCEQLFFGIIGDCTDAARFRWAWAAGQPWSGVPLDKAYGSPIAVTVRRTCPRTGENPALAATAAYEGVNGNQVGFFDPVFGGYGYYLPALGLGEVGAITLMYVQNTGLECASVELWFQDREHCGEDRLCDTFTVQPGETRMHTASSCGGPGLNDAGWLRSTQPLAIAVDAVGSQVMTSYRAEPAPAYRADPSPSWVGAVIYSQLHGWNTVVSVQNLSPATSAKVKVYFLDLAGDIITALVDTVCPRGSATFDLSKVADLPGQWIGSVRVESQLWHAPDEPDGVPPALAGLVTLTQQGASGPLQAVTYRLEPPVGITAADLDPADPRLQIAAPERRRVAIPSLRKLGDSATEIGIANLVTTPGFTDFAIYIFDQNGLLDFLCQKLTEKSVEYIDLMRWGYVNTGFRGSAMLSAVYWEHEVSNPDGSLKANPVSLGAVIINRDRAEVPARDQAEAMNGVPITIPRAFGMPSCPSGAVTPHPTATIPRSATPTQHVIATRTPRGVSTGSPAPTASPGAPPNTTTPSHGRGDHMFLPAVHKPAPAPTRTPAPGSTLPPAPTPEPPATDKPVGPTATPAPTVTPLLNGAVHLPVLNFQGGEDVCSTLLAVQSLGEEPTKVALVAWGEAGFCPPQCAGPLKVECSGLIKPGGNWFLFGAQIPTGTRSGAVYSFSARTDPTLESGDASIADYLCQQLFFDVVGDCNDYRRFKLAYDTGGEFAGIPLARAYGAPIAVTAQRTCPGDRTPATEATSSYAGIQYPDGADADAEQGGYSYYMPGLVAQEAKFNSTVYIQNAGEQCASIELWFRDEQDSLRARICELLTLAPGEAVHASAADCAAPGWRGTAWLRSSERLAVLSETIGEDMLSTSGASTTGPARRSDGSYQETVLYGPVVFDPGTGWTTRVAVQNLDRITSARVKVTLRDAHGIPVDSLSDWVFARNSRTFVFPMSGHRAGVTAGSLRVESEAWRVDPNSPPQTPVPITAQVTMTNSDGATPPMFSGAAAYELLPSSAVMGTAPTQWSGVLALPLVASDPTGLGLTSELAVTNLLDQHVGGSTRYQVRFYDASGAVATLCDTLPAGEARYFGATALASRLPAAFHGSAVISAIWWGNGSTAGRPSGPLGLGAVVVQRSLADTAPDSYAVTDPVSMAVGVPLSEALPGEVRCGR